MAVVLTVNPQLDNAEYISHNLRKHVHWIGGQRPVVVVLPELPKQSNGMSCLSMGNDHKSRSHSEQSGQPQKFCVLRKGYTVVFTFKRARAPHSQNQLAYMKFVPCRSRGTSEVSH